MFPLWLTVDVALEDVALGRQGHCLACPIARALHKLGYRNFTVTEDCLEFENGVVYSTPSQAARFIKLFDAGYVPRSRVFTFRRSYIPALVLAAEVEFKDIRTPASVTVQHSENRELGVNCG